MLSDVRLIVMAPSKITETSVTVTKLSFNATKMPEEGELNPLLNSEAFCPPWPNLTSG
jgi:hypothetical protein